MKARAQQQVTEADPPASGSMLLTEFDVVPWLVPRLNLQRPFALVLAWSCIAAIPLVLGWLSGANCFWVTIHDGNSETDVSVPFGYLAELNHGIFYLLGIPLFLWGGMSFIRKATAAFENLSRSSVPHDTDVSNRLVILDKAGNEVGGSREENREALFSDIARRNRRFFTVALWTIPSLLLALLLVTELPTLHTTRFGWVQSANLSTLPADIGENGAVTEDGLLNDVEINELQRVKTAFEVGDVEWYAQGNESRPLKVKIVHPDSHDGDRWKTWMADSKRWNTPFLVSALAVEWMSHVILIWVALKILFVVWILASSRWVDEIDVLPVDDSGAKHPALADQFWLRSLLGRRVRYRLALDFVDEFKRFGIRILDSVYMSALWLTLLASMMFWAGKLSNMNKGLGWVWVNWDLRVGQPLQAFLVLTVLLAIFGYPFYHVIRSLARKKNERIEAAGDNREEETRILQQSLWPGIKTPYFTILLSCFGFLVLLPLGLPLLAGEELTEFVTVFAEIWPSIVCPFPK